VEFDKQTDVDKLLDEVAGALEDFRDRERPAHLAWTADVTVPARRGDDYDE